MTPARPPVQPGLEVEARRRRARAVRDQFRRLSKIEAGIADMEARLPAMRGEVADIREKVERLFAGEDIEEGDDGEASTV